MGMGRFACSIFWSNQLQPQMFFLSSFYMYDLRLRVVFAHGLGICILQFLRTAKSHYAISAWRELPHLKPAVRQKPSQVELPTAFPGRNEKNLALELPHCWS